MGKVRFISAPVGKNSSFIARLIFLKKYDVLFYLTDGSIFLPTSKTNILHIQSPLKGQPSTSIWGKIKLKGWNTIIYNSEFTRRNSEGNWPHSSVVVYPPVDTDKIKALPKKNYILSVGRFFGYLKDKKHELLIKIFRNLYKEGKIKNWSLHLVGSAGEGDKNYLDELKALAEDMPVKFYPNLGYDELIRLYGESSVYWHAMGFEESDPTKMEHFGISTVEAMAGGCVPIVINKGGQREIVEDGKCGFLWNNLDEFQELTTKIILNKTLRDEFSKQAGQKAKVYSKKTFEEKILKLLK